MSNEKEYKQCRFCCEDIVNESILCRFCLKEQRKYWHVGDNWFNLASCAAYFVLAIYLWGGFKPDFSNYVEDLTAQQVNVVELNENEYAVVFSINNDSDKKWHDLTYQLIGSNNNDEVILTQEGDDIMWLIQPNSHAFVTIKMSGKPSNTSWELLIRNLESS